MQTLACSSWLLLEYTLIIIMNCSRYKYSDEACELLNTHELHMKAIREIEFSKDGKNIVTASKDKSILMTDIETGKLTNAWDQAHS